MHPRLTHSESYHRQGNCCKQRCHDKYRTVIEVDGEDGEDKCAYYACYGNYAADRAALGVRSYVCQQCGVRAERHEQEKPCEGNCRNHQPEWGMESQCDNAECCTQAARQYVGAALAEGRISAVAPMSYNRLDQAAKSERSLVSRATIVAGIGPPGLRKRGRPSGMV